MNFNKAIIMGGVTKDPEIRALPSGQNVVSFSVATNRKYTNDKGKQEEVEFHNIVVFGKLADIAGAYIKKGSQVLVEGRLQTRNWQDQQGQKHWKTEIIAENLQFNNNGKKEDTTTEQGTPFAF